MDTNKYGLAAIETVKLCRSRYGISPQDSWDQATKRIFGEGTSGQKKGCPKGAFLGLCSEGLIKGIPKGEYTRSIENRAYAVSAVNILKSNPALTSDLKRLWESGFIS